MTCSRCSAEAVVKRDAAYYCGKCAMARDWEEIIAIVQADAAPVSKVDFGAPSAAPADADPEPVVEVIKAEPEPVAKPAPAPEPAAEPEVEVISADPEPVAEPVVAAAAAANELPADPFA